MTSTEAFDAVQIISIKRDKGTLTPEQIDWTIDAYTRGVIAEEQMAALNMAILLNGMDRAEISRWTSAMIASGERMDFSSLTRPDGGTEGYQRQALHRWGRGQNHAAAGTARCRVRRRGSTALRPRAGPHGRNVGQTGSHPGVAGQPEQ